MSTLHASATAVFVLQILISAFFAILFLQSGIDKVVDRRGNLEWLTGHFAKSPLARAVPLLLSAITLMELAAGGLSGVGCALILFRHDPTIAFYGAIASGVSLFSPFSSASEWPRNIPEPLCLFLIFWL